MNRKKLTLVLVAFIVLLSSLIVSASNEKDNVVKEFSQIQTKIMNEEDTHKELLVEKERLQKILDNGVGSEVTVLSYSNVFDISESNLPYNQSVPEFIGLGKFEAQIDYLSKNNYYFTTLDEMMKFKNNEIQLPKKTVLIAIDNGYKSARTVIYPVLEKYNIRAEIFLAGDEISKESSDIEFLDFKDIVAIQDRIKIQTKTNLYKKVDGNSLFRISSDDEAYKDLESIKSKFGSTYLAYPNKGDENFHSKALSNAKIQGALSMNPGKFNVKTSKFNIPKYIISKNVNFDDFKIIVKD